MYVNLEITTLKGHKLKQLLSVLLRQRHMAENYIINPKQVSMWCSQPKLLFTNQNPNGSLEISKSTMDYTTVNQVLLPRSGEGKGVAYE